MKKILFKIIFGLLAVTVIVFGLYLYDLHALALKSNEIFEQRCLTVNPALIAYKNSFLGFAEGMKKPGKYSDKQLADFYSGYIEGMRNYAPKEAFWILVQSDFVNRWDFKLIEPWYIKEAGDYQIKMYEGYRDEAQASVDVVDGKITTEEYKTRFTDARDRRNKYTDLYNGVFDKAMPIRDWRKIFASVPVPSGCNDGNLIIPDTSGALDPTPTPIKDPDITG